MDLQTFVRSRPIVSFLPVLGKYCYYKMLTDICTYLNTLIYSGLFVTTFNIYSVAVLFVVALDSYSARSAFWDDEKCMVMHKSIELFTEVCNSKWFRKSEMILLLNRSDLFTGKHKVST